MKHRYLLYLKVLKRLADDDHADIFDLAEIFINLIEDKTKIVN